jgi:hypothetical protein
MSVYLEVNVYAALFPVIIRIINLFSISFRITGRKKCV